MITVGIDIGSISTKVVLGPSKDCEIVRSEVGSHTTPTAISFSDMTGGRNIGETANLKAADTIVHLNRLLPGVIEDGDTFQSFYRFGICSSDNEKGVIVNTPIFKSDQVKEYEAAAILAMLLGKIKKNVNATLQRLSCSEEVKYILSLPPKSTNEARQVLNDAAYAAGLGDALILNSAACLATAYKRKFPEGRYGGENVTLVIDMGHSQTSVTVFKLSQKSEENPRPIEILSSISNKSLGAGSVDIKLYHHFLSTIPSFQNITITPASKSGQRLLDACSKLKHLLSQLNDGKVVVENIVNDSDVPISCTRKTLDDICQEEQTNLSNLIENALEQADEEITIESIEILGGACRIPTFQSIIRQTLANTTKASLSPKLQNEMILSPSLDDTSVALGAAVLGDATNVDDWVIMKSSSKSFFDEDINQNNDEYRQTLFDAEHALQSIDEEISQKSEIRNKLEEHVLSMRSAKYSKHASLLPDSNTLDEHLQQVDDWLFSEESDEATLIDMQTKLDTTINKTNEMCAAYFQAIIKEEQAKEKEMEEEAKKAQAEANGVDEEDHDNRRLPKKRRMEIVLKNKAEANELFSHGNYRHAAARYTKALSHCAKFVDLNPDDLEEVKGVKLSLNLNLALAYYKLQKYDQSLRVCNEALVLDENSPKALYRRAMVYYEKKKWEEANKDLKKASGIAPEDKAIKKLQGNVDVMIKRQKAKEKKMAQKMFG